MAAYTVNPPFISAAAVDALAENLVAKAEDYANQLSHTVIFAPVINPNFPTLAAAPAPVTAPLPALQEVTWQVPAQPAAFQGTVNVDAILPGPFQGIAPTLNFGSPPAAFNTPAPGSPAIDLNFQYPDVKVVFPTAPALLSLDTVIFPKLSVPAFTANVPGLTAVAPNTFHYVEGATFTSALLTQLETDLQNALSEGAWTGLPPAAEQGLFDRAREREYRTQADALASLEQMEELGYAFPPGVFIDARIKLQTETHNTTAGLSREIMIKQAELSLENIVKARANATDLEGKLIDYTNQVAQRAFDAAKYVTEAAIAIYNAQVQAYTASLEGFKTEAIIYETQIKGIMAQVELVKGQIEFEQVKAQINTALVEQYKAQVQAAEAVLEIFKTQVQIIQTKADVEKIKVEVFGEQIKAYVGQINAYTAQVEGYKAQAETQGVIEGVFKTQVDAYSAQVNAGVAEANAKIAVFRGQIEAYTAQLEGYKASVQGMIGQAQAASLFNTAEADVYRAETAALSAYNNVLTAQWQAVLNEQEKVAEVGIAAAKSNGDLYIAARGLSLDASKVGAQVTAQLGAAALGAIHWSQTSSWSTAGSSALNDITTTNTSTSEVDENIKTA